MIRTLNCILISMRPNQWVKNVFIFAGLIFSRNLFQGDLLIRVIVGFILFSLASSSIYIFNDIKDVRNDREHPEKCERPLAAGLLSLRAAYVTSIIFGTTSLLIAFFVNRTFSGTLAAYILVNIAYSLKIKQIVILDVICIAFGFVMRVIAGTILAGVAPSEWLFLCTITISLFLGFSKRRYELSLISGNANNHRKVLMDYSVPFLDQMIAVATACTVMSYALYAISSETVARFGTKNLVFTIPFVLYGVYRYLYLIHQKAAGGNPTTAVLTDVPLFVNGLLWLATIIIIIY